MAEAENLNVLRERGAGGGGGIQSAEGLTRRVESHQRVGRIGLNTGRSRLFRYDRTQGLAGAQMKAEADQADRMPELDALELLDKIHEAYGLKLQNEAYLYDFDYAMFVCYALNGGSQLGPYGRVSFYVSRSENGGSVQTDKFAYSTVHTMCGIDLRRFFRTYANEVIDSCRNLYNKFDVDDSIQLEMRNRMISLASTRGLSRFPYLLGDCVDAATNLSEVELSAVLSSKERVIAATPNAVDQMNNVKNIRSSDNYDSSTGRNVSSGNDIHSGGPTYYQ